MVLHRGLFSPRVLVPRGNRGDSEPGRVRSHAHPVAPFWAWRASLISEITTFYVKQGGSNPEEWRKDKDHCNLVKVNWENQCAYVMRFAYSFPLGSQQGF